MELFSLQVVILQLTIRPKCELIRRFPSICGATNILVVYDDTVGYFWLPALPAKALHWRVENLALPLGLAHEILPSVAYCSENDQYLVAWQNPQPDIYARFINGDGSLDGASASFGVYQCRGD